MRILYIIAGAGRMQCDICLRDGLLARNLKAKGHDVLFVPMYTPLPSSLEHASSRQLFYGGINVFLQQKFPFFRSTPRFLDKLFDVPWLLDFVSRFGHLTQARDLAELTISVLEAEAGHQRKELDNLTDWLQTQPKPDAVILPNSLLAGLARPIRASLGSPVFCLLSGEDMFVDEFPEPYRTRTLDLLRRKARDIDGFMASSDYYADFMSRYLNLPPQKIRTTVSGIDCRDYPAHQRTAPEVYTIGYRAQISPPNGLHLLVEAWHQLKSRPETGACRLKVAGHLAPVDRAYFQDIQAKVKRWGLENDFEYAGELDPSERIVFLNSLSVFSVPAVYPEPMGLYVPEALAAGVPVVLPRLGCLAEWVECTEGGLLVAPNDAAALAAALACLMKDENYRESLGAAGRIAVHRDYGIEQMAASILSALTAILQPPTPGLSASDENLSSHS